MEVERCRLGSGGAVRYHAMPDEPTPGRALVTRRAIADIVRNATLGSYGVAGFAGAGPSGLRISLRDGGLRITLAEQQRGVAAGQSAVLYEPDAERGDRVLGQAAVRAAREQHGTVRT